MNELPIGETLDRGRYTIVECVRGDLLRGTFRAQGPLGRALVTLAPRQQATLELALGAPQITPLLHIGPCSLSGIDGMIEAEPAGAPLGERALPLADALAVVRDACAIVAGAHRRELVLRGMRPELIYVDGTSIIAIAPRCEPFLMTAAPSSQGVIHPFDHYYLAPELLRLQPPTAAADVFSLGALLAMLVTGEHPFVGDMPYEQLVAILRGDRRPWTGPADLAAVVARALDPDPRTARRRPRSPPSSGSPRSQGHFRRGAVLHPGPPAAVPVDSTTYYGTYGPMVLRRCRKLLGDEQAARDAMHDVFVQVLSRADALDDRAPSSLLFRIATNVCLNRLRTRKRRPEDGDPDLLVEIAAQTDPAARSAARSALDLLFRNEPDDTAVIAVLHLVDKMTLEEVAAEVGMSVSGIRKRLAKLRSKLHALEVPS